jgi:hypothetical protein
MAAKLKYWKAGTTGKPGRYESQNGRAETTGKAGKTGTAGTTGNAKRNDRKAERYQ